MNQSVLYLECNSGISGDMTVAALLDLGADRQTLLDALASLPLTGYSIEIKEVYKSGLRACDFNVILEHDNHDHDMKYLHGHGHDADAAPCGHPHEQIHETAAPHGHPHEHIHEASASQEHFHEHVHDAAVPHDHELHIPDTNPGTHEHHHEAGAPHEHHHEAAAPHEHHHEARNLQDITEIIRAGALTDRARSLAFRIFRILAEAEASVHGKSVEEIHFHEVGAVDSIVDIVAVAVCLDNLNPARVVVSPLTDGTGQIRCQHGLIPVPVPAVTAIAAQNNLTLKLTDIEGELVTPTGAAIAAALQCGSLSSAAPQTLQFTRVTSNEQFEHANSLREAQTAARITFLRPQQQVLRPDLNSNPQTDTTQSGPSPSATPWFDTPQQGTQQSSHRLSAAKLPAAFRIQKTGLGAGKRNYATTGVLRAMLLEPQEVPGEENIPASQNSSGPNSAPSDSRSATGVFDCVLPYSRSDTSVFGRVLPDSRNNDDDSADTILSLETNIDDCTGEALSFTMQQLLEHGALDVFYVPIYMKKNRPAYQLRVLCHADRRTALESIIFQNTTTIGIRVQEMRRTKLPRQILSLQTPWGTAEVKRCTYGSETYFYPENDSVSALAQANRIGFPEMYHLIQEYAGKISKE